MRYLLIVASALTLAGCDPTDEQVAKVRAALPAGCVVRDLGSYGDINHLVVVTCNDRRTQTQNFRQHQGKTTVPVTVIQVEATDGQ